MTKTMTPEETPEESQSLPPHRPHYQHDIKSSTINDSAAPLTGQLILSTGDKLYGTFIGAPRSCRGEMVFTTSLVGYTESITDPSYFGQILTFAYPLIGNYGIPTWSSHHQLPPLGYESSSIAAAGIIVNHHCDQAFHHTSSHNLDRWLKHYQVPGLTGIDTRHLIHLIRDNAPLLGRIEAVDPNINLPPRSLGDWMPPQDESFVDASQHTLLPYVSCQAPILYQPTSRSQSTPRIALIDCGVKAQIIRKILAYGCEVLRIPWNSSLQNIDCSGWVISNGPGDPAYASSLINEIKGLLTESRPILGICLGHQLLGLAAGMHCERMTYGHRSHNQPVYEVGRRKCYMSSQNHGFHLIDHPTSQPSDWQVWFRNANDQSIEGIRHNTKPFRSVQFHPESAGGPQDTAWIISEFCSQLTIPSSL